MYSYYQNIKSGLLSGRYYSKVDVQIEQEKINTIKAKYENLSDDLRIKADKLLKTYSENIEFICRMINQRILEDSI